MVRKVILSGLAFLFLAQFYSCQTYSPDMSADKSDSLPEAEGREPVEYCLELSDELVAGLESDDVLTRASTADPLLTSTGTEELIRMFPDAGEWEERHREAGLHRWYKIRTSLPATKASEQLNGIPGVLSFGECPKIKPASFNDPLLQYQWHYQNDGSFGTLFKYGAAINVEPVWKHYTGGSQDVIVGVVDGGIDYSHEDLAGVCIEAGPEGSRNFIRNFDPYKIIPHYHGTHVAGTIASINNNGVGGCGVAGGLDGKGGVRLLSCQIFSDNPSDPKQDYSGDSYSAIVWAADHGAVICQNSWGYVYSSALDAARGSVSGPDRAAIDYFIRYAGLDSKGNQVGPMKGGVVFFSAGNDNFADGWPAEYGPVIAVGATGINGQRAYYSNYGNWVDIAAPGGDRNAGLVLSTVPGNKYDSYQGTSMACPHASGVAALLVSYYGGEGFTNEMLIERLLEGADNSVAFDKPFGPMLNALGAFTLDQSSAPAPVTEFSVKPSSNRMTVSWDVTADELGRPAYSYTVYVSKFRDDVLAWQDSPDKCIVKQISTSSAKVGSRISAQIDNLDFDEQYFVAIVGQDRFGALSGLSPVKSVRTDYNHAPVISSDTVPIVVIRQHESKTLSFTFSDPEDHRIDVKCFSSNPGISSVLSEKGELIVVADGRNGRVGKDTVKIIARDEYGAASSFQFEVVFYENHAPVALKDSEQLITEQYGNVLTVLWDDWFMDVDGEKLNYTVSVDNQSVINLFRDDKKVRIVAVAYGLATVRLKAGDSFGKEAQVEISVYVRKPDEGFLIYPNPVTDYLKISCGESQDFLVEVKTAWGVTVYNDRIRGDYFNPAQIDFSAFKSGQYYISVHGERDSTKCVIIKR